MSKGRANYPIEDPPEIDQPAALLCKGCAFRAFKQVLADRVTNAFDYLERQRLESEISKAAEALVDGGSWNWDEWINSVRPG